MKAFNGPSSWSYNVHNAVFQADKSALLGVVMWFTPKYPLFNLRLLLTQPTCIISRLYRLRTGFLKLKFDLRKADLPVLEHIARYMGKRMDKVSFFVPMLLHNAQKSEIQPCKGTA